jgi:predicted molibdopterin-dependent oxidoreductase YjgC
MSEGGATRIEHGVTRPAAVTITVDEATVAAYPGESLATALTASGRRVFRRTRTGAARGPFCNMGVCFDCLVDVAGRGRVRACLTRVEAGMVVRTQTPGVAPG